MVSPQEARAFCDRWLPTWTGGDATALLEFYAPDALYADPSVPAGVTGDALREHLTALLAANPRWVWTHTGSVPMEGGFVSRWHATWPLRDRVAEVDGICLVWLRDGLIVRNEVFFDRLGLTRPRPAAPTG